MKNIYLAFLIVLFITCKKEVAKTDSLLHYIPNNAALVIKINDFEVLKSDLKNNNFLKNLQKTEHYPKLISKIKPLESLDIKNKAIVSFVEVGKEKFEFLLQTTSDSLLLDLFTIKNKSIEEIGYENATYTKITMDSTSVFNYTRASNTFTSSSQLLIENLIRSKEPSEIDEGLAQLYAASSKTKAAVVFIHTKYSNGILNRYLNKNKSVVFSDFSEWISLDINIEQTELNFSGISTAEASTKFVSLFQHIEPTTNLTPSFAPLNAKAILSFTFENFADFYKNQQLFLETLPKKDTVFNSVHELGVVYFAQKKVVILQNYGAENILKYLEEKSKETVTYQGNDMVALTDTNVLRSFTSLISDFETNYYTILENTFIFSEDIESLQNCISSFKNEATFDKSETYNSIKNSIADESNILLVVSPEGIDNFMKDHFKNDILKDLEKLVLKEHTLVAQLVADQRFYHTSLHFKKIASKTELNMTAPLFTVRLDSDIANQTQFVRNHQTNKKELVVQDQDNYLYLIGTDGKVLWKKELDGKILGKIEQVDLYKNGRLQLAFATANTVTILDRNGDLVQDFKTTITGGPISSFSVFDYDTTRNYRFLIVQDRKITMLDNSAKIVAGFNFKEANSKITQAPKHFRMNTKDYIVFPEENGTLRILSRTGTDRILVKQKINFSQNEIYAYNNKFTTTDTKGNLYQIDEKGTITQTKLNFNKDHGLQTTSSVLATMNENTLSIKGKSVALELGVYTKPQIFYIANKIYVSVTDIQNQKIYLFDSKADPIANFPVYGTSVIDLADMDNDKKLELVAKDLENSLIVYRIN